MKVMLALFKRNPKRKLQKQYNKLVKEATELQRMGDVLRAALMFSEADDIQRQIEALNLKA